MGHSRETCGKLVLDCGGGLGNQMFEYAAALSFAKRWNRQLEVVQPIKKHAQWNNFSRPFQLEEFDISAKVREATLLDRLFFSRNARLDTVRNLFNTMLGVETITERQIYRFENLQPRKAKSNVYVVGNWQDIGYFAQDDVRLRKEFTFKMPPMRQNAEYARHIQSLPCPVSVHLRLGDYAQIFSATGVSMVLSKGYYEAALAFVNRQFPKATLIVFSDDIPQAKELLRDRARCLFIEGNTPDTAHEDMRLMAMCHHHVMANSSFSWWGAWLNPRLDKQVFVPRYWGNTADSDYPGLRLPGWIALDHI